MEVSGRRRCGMRLDLLGAAMIAVSVGLAATAQAATAPLSALSNTTWRAYQGGEHSSNFTALKQVTPANVSQLQVAWTYDRGDKLDYVFSPIVIDEVAYGLAHNGQLTALNAATGAELWRAALPDGASFKRGINYWQSKDGKDRRLLVLMGNHVYAYNAEDGRPITSFGENGRASLIEGLDRDPATLASRSIVTDGPGQVFENLLILGSAPGELVNAAPGDIRAFDVITGKQVWTFHTVPRPGEFGYDTWVQKEAWKYIGAANNWGDMTLDAPNGIVFVPTGSPSSDFYGAGRHGDNLFGSSLLALDARTGKRIWHYQVIHHDLWDYDNVSAPQLLTTVVAGRPREIVAMAGKTGFLYVFDRKTGEPIWPIEERPVPQTNVPGEWTSPTQPFPTKPPPFARQSFTENDINNLYFSQEEQAYWKDFVSKAVNKGLFTPPEVGKYVVNMPGSSGGAALYGTSADPTSGTVYVISFDYPAFRRLETSQAAARNNGTHGPLISYISGCYSICPPGAKRPDPPEGYPLDPLPYPEGIEGTPKQHYYSGYGFALGMGRPPWTSITAYDLNKGEIKWKIPYGEAVGVQPAGNNYGLLQFHSPKAPVLVTSSGLLFTASTDKKFRAYDKETGKVVWSADLPEPAMGALATYELGGRQYILVSARGKYIAYSLPAR